MGLDTGLPGYVSRDFGSGGAVRFGLETAWNFRIAGDTPTSGSATGKLGCGSGTENRPRRCVTASIRQLILS